MLYKNDEEMFHYIDLLLSDDNLRNKIANNGHLLSEKHTYLERCKKLLEIYTNL
jgi:spore maturation protein CgeB